MSRRVEIRNPEVELSRFRARLAVAGSVVVVLFAILLTRFFYVQVVQHDYYHALAENNRISIVPVVPNRGLILDRNGVVLAHNYSAYTLEITPSKVPDLEAAISGLASVVEITAKDRKRFKRLMDESKSFESLPIRTRLSEEEVAKFAANRYRFPGVEINARLFRQYPNGEHAAHSVGYIGRISDRDLEQIEARGDTANYRGTDHIGKFGLEESYERDLHGITGFERVEVDSGGRAVRSLARQPPVSGNNLILALDLRLQEVAEKIFGNYRGALVAIEPKTGGVLALVSRPSFDPNLFVDGIDPQNWDALNNNPDKPLNNRGLQGQYPPGSTFKPFMALAALELGKRSPSYTIADPGYFMLPGVSHRWRDWKAGGHGMVDLHKSIVISCDTYYYGLAQELGIDAIHDFVSQLGFGSKTGIDIKGEQPGVLPNQAWKMRRYKQKWFAGDTISVGIGQGYNLATPLQLALGTAVIAANGAVYQPHLVREIEDSRTKTLTPVATAPVRMLDLKRENVQRVKAAMVDVTRPGGTAGRAGAGAQYVFGGKTGTAQVIAMKQGERYDEKKVAERHRDHALFIAFAPADDPKIALGIMVENGGHGGSTAAPIARKLLDFYLLGKLPESMQVGEDDADAGD